MGMAPYLIAIICNLVTINQVLTVKHIDWSTKVDRKVQPQISNNVHCEYNTQVISFAFGHFWLEYNSDMPSPQMPSGSHLGTVWGLNVLDINVIKINMS